MGPSCAAARIAAVVCALALPAGSLRAADEPPAAAADAPPGRQITYKDDTLTVRLADVLVSEVLEEIGRQAGAEIRGGVVAERVVSTEFEAVPLPEALHRLLGDQNFALVYGEGDHLRVIKLLGGPQQVTKPPATPGAPPTPAAPAKPNNAVATLLGLVASHPPVQVGGKLAQVLGSSMVTLPQVLE